MSAALQFLARFWPYAAGVALIAAAALSLVAWAEHRGFARAAGQYQARIDRLQSDIAARTAAAEQADLRHARAIEQTRAAISNEVSHDYQNRLAALRDRYDRMRAAPQNPAGCGAGADLPGLPDAAVRPDAAAAPDRLPCPTALTATEQAMQLEALQDWVREQQRIVQ